MQEYLGNNIVFIVGCPRSGTTWLRMLLASDPSIHSGAESYIFAWYIGSQLRNWHKDVERTSTKIGMSTYMKESEFLFALRQYMESLLKPMVNDLRDGEIFVEKTPEHALYIKEIAELLPKCKFVHILRDGRDVVSSLLAISKQTVGSWAPHSARIAAKMWTDYVLGVRKSSKNIPSNQFYELRYEDLHKATIETLKPIFEFMEVEWQEEIMINAVKRLNANVPGLKKVGFAKKAAPGGWKEELSPTQKALVWIQIHKVMKDLGYVWKFPW